MKKKKFIVEVNDGIFLKAIPDWNMHTTDKKEEAKVFENEEFFIKNYPLMILHELDDKKN